MKIDFYYWGSICPLSIEILELLKKYEKYLSIEYYDITDNFELAKTQNIYFPFLTVIDDCHRYYSPLSKYFMEELKCGRLPEEKPYRIKQGEIEVEENLLPITKKNYNLAVQCTGNNDCKGYSDKCHMYPFNDVFGFINVKDHVLLGGAEFYPSLNVPYNIPKNKDTAFITCVYLSDENYDYKSKPLQELEKYLASSYSKVMVISDEEGTFPNGNLAFFQKNGYIDEGVVYEDDYCKLHLLIKTLNRLEHKAAKRYEAKAARKYFAKLSISEQLDLIEELLKQSSYGLFSIATLWIKMNPVLLDIKYFPLYEKWLFQSVDSWGRCDQYCYRVLNPMIEAYPQLFTHVLKWTQSEQVYVKRASAVCLIHSSAEFSVKVGFEQVASVCEALLHEEHLHIRKGVGWLLKYSMLAYPDATICFIKEHLQEMDTTTFAYALEKLPDVMKHELRSLRKSIRNQQTYLL